ncbi:hypothetical protein QR680_015272 [Steinernema hermaphroditum]|uniref:C-type lectin domain-containing protein n=1 Tax=Steinernema hermaphroditum TaxID=289476 RepID=A0AA39H9Q7_9BILA|nr:hypothetical protein QR680_015272 [Steinernema hermaphroditum]
MTYFCTYLLVLSLIAAGVGSDTCDFSRIANSPVFPCSKDVVFVLDASSSMKTVENIEKQLSFVQELISHWTFGDLHGMRVAFAVYGLNHDVYFSFYYTSLPSCIAKIWNFRKKLAKRALKEHSLTRAIQEVERIYASDPRKHRENPLFRHRPGLKPRFIIFSSTIDSEDIATAELQLKSLSRRRYESILAISQAPIHRYGSINSAKILHLDRRINTPDELFKEVVSGLCFEQEYDEEDPDPPYCIPPPPPTVPPTSTPSPVKTTTKSPSIPKKEHNCSCTLGKLWLDIVIAIDTSDSMTEDGLNGVLALLATWIAQSTVGPSKQQSLRVGIVTFDTDVRTVADLNALRSTSDVVSTLSKITITGGGGVDVGGALRRAGNIFASSDERPNAKNVVLLISSAYNPSEIDNPRNAANHLKSSGTEVITIAYVQPSETQLVKAIGELASPGMAYSNTDGDLTDELVKTFCWINCFCKNNWMPYKSPLHSSESIGECVRFHDAEATWTSAADLVCPRLSEGGHLVHVFSKEKHDFLIELARNASSHAEALKFHIGLSHNGEGYYWSAGQTENMSPLPLGPNDYQCWNPGSPNSQDGKCVASAQNADSSIGWSNIDCHADHQRYICQAPICDTDHYCASID